MFEKEMFIIQDDNGQDITCRVVFNFETDDHSYVLYAVEGDETGNISALRYTLDDSGEISGFDALETEEEWAMVEEVMNTVVDQFGEDQSKFITITDDMGEDVIAEILYRFELPEFNKNYLFYSISDEEVPDEIFASAYIADANGFVEQLLPIETDEEWAKVEQVLTSLQQQN